MGERPGDESALFGNGGFWVTGLDDGRCIVFGAAGGDDCFMGDRADGPVAKRGSFDGAPLM